VKKTQHPTVLQAGEEQRRSKGDDAKFVAWKKSSTQEVSPHVPAVVCQPHMWDHLALLVLVITIDIVACRIILNPAALMTKL
jgi:hypothetical protein